MARPSYRSRCWKWLIIMMPLRAAMPSTDRKPTSEPERDDAAGGIRRQHAADQGRGQRQEAQDRQAPALEGELQQQEDPDHRQRPRRTCRCCCAACSSTYSPCSIGAIAEREADLVQTPLHFLRHGAEVAALDVGLHVDAAGSSLALDDVRGRQDLHIGHLAQADPFARGCVDQHLLDGGEAVAPGSGVVHTCTS